MEPFSALLAICAGNSPVPGEFLAQRPVTRSFDVFFDLRLNKRLRKQSWGWWFETLSWSLWRQCNDNEIRWYHYFCALSTSRVNVHTTIDPFPDLHIVTPEISCFKAFVLFFISVFVCVCVCVCLFWVYQFQYSLHNYPMKCAKTCTHFYFLRYKIHSKAGCLCARLHYLQCVSNGDTAVLH